MAEIKGDFQRLQRDYLETKTRLLNLTLHVEHGHEWIASYSRTKNLYFALEIIRIYLFQIDQVFNHAQDEI